MPKKTQSLFFFFFFGSHKSFLLTQRLIRHMYTTLCRCCMHYRLGSFLSLRIIHLGRLLTVPRTKQSLPAMRVIPQRKHSLKQTPAPFSDSKLLAPAQDIQDAARVATISHLCCFSTCRGIFLTSFLSLSVCPSYWSSIVFIAFRFCAAHSVSSI